MARLRTMATIHATGCAASGSKLPAACQIFANASCSTSSASSARPTMRFATPSSSGAASLYERLGGKPAITAVVEDFVGNVAGDARINARFANADIPRLKTMLVDQVCAASGGPCKYTGADMRSAHRGMKITEGEFNALV